MPRVNGELKHKSGTMWSEARSDRSRRGDGDQQSDSSENGSNVNPSLSRIRKTRYESTLQLSYRFGYLWFLSTTTERPQVDLEERFVFTVMMWMRRSWRMRVTSSRRGWMMTVTRVWILVLIWDISRQSVWWHLRRYYRWLYLWWQGTQTDFKQRFTTTVMMVRRRRTPMTRARRVWVTRTRVRVWMGVVSTQMRRMAWVWLLILCNSTSFSSWSIEIARE